MSAVLINGTSIAWENVNIVILGSVIQGVTKIDYKRTGNHTTNYGAGSEPISYGYGQYKYQASIEMYLEEWKRINLAANGNPLSLAPFNISITVSPTDDSVVFPYTDTLYNVKFMEEGMTTTYGDTKVLVTIPLMISGFSQFQ